MQALVHAARARSWGQRFDAQIVAVISNKMDSKGLIFAANEGLATQVIDHQAFAHAPNPREAFDASLATAIDAHEPALVLLAGFMRILTTAFVNRFEGRLLNIHPSLLPAFPGLHTHARALAAGCKVAGATVHDVTAELDHGPIWAQACVPVLANDDADTLAARVLTQEHVIYPQAVEQWLRQHAAGFACDNKIAI